MLPHGTYHKTDVADISQPNPFMTTKGCPTRPEHKGTWNYSHTNTSATMLTLPAACTELQTTFSVGLERQKRWFQKKKDKKCGNTGSSRSDKARVRTKGVQAFQWGKAYRRRIATSASAALSTSGCASCDRQAGPGGPPPPVPSRPAPARERPGPRHLRRSSGAGVSHRRRPTATPSGPTE